MKLPAKSAFKNPKPGTVNAVCTKIIDMGTQETKFGSKRELWIFWEVSQLMEDGRPFSVRNTYAASVHPMSNLGKHLKSWMGRDLTAEEGINFDIKQMLGKGAILTLVENGDYINVATVAGLIDGMTPLVPVGELVYFDLDNYDEAIFAGFSEKMRKMIAETKEYKHAIGEEVADENSIPHDDGQVPPPASDDIPF